MIEISSQDIVVKIEEKGAQVVSVYDKNIDLEYLWQRDASIWSSSSPVVFPVIGKLNNLEYRHHGQVYTMKSNGIIRYEEIPVLSKGDNFVEFLYVNNEKTKENYPFECRFKIRYEITGKVLNVIATIYNDDKETMYYNYAGHPGFNVPMFENETCNDYYVEFEKEETTDIYQVCETGQLIEETTQFFHNEKRFFIRKNLFQKEALAFKHPESKSVSIKSLNHEHGVKVTFDGFDNLGIWSPYVKDKELKFICIEPWVGHTDFKGYTGTLSQRDEVASLEANCHKEYKYSIELK